MLRNELYSFIVREKIKPWHLDKNFVFKKLAVDEDKPISVFHPSTKLRWHLLSHSIQIDESKPTYVYHATFNWSGGPGTLNIKVTFDERDYGQVQCYDEDSYDCSNINLREDQAIAFLHLAKNEVLTSIMSLRKLMAAKQKAIYQEFLKAEKALHDLKQVNNGVVDKRKYIEKFERVLIAYQVLCDAGFPKDESIEKLNQAVKKQLANLENTVTLTACNESFDNQSRDKKKEQFFAFREDLDSRIARLDDFIKTANFQKLDKIRAAFVRHYLLSKELFPDFLISENMELIESLKHFLAVNVNDIIRSALSDDKPHALEYVLQHFAMPIDTWVGDNDLSMINYCYQNIRRECSLVLMRHHVSLFVKVIDDLPAIYHIMRNPDHYLHAIIGELKNTLFKKGDLDYLQEYLKSLSSWSVQNFKLFGECASPIEALPSIIKELKASEDDEWVVIKCR